MNFKLRPWTIADLDSLIKNSDNNNITQFMSDGFPNSPEKWKTFIEFTIVNKDILYLAIEVNGEAIGGIGITPEKGIMRKNAELGYWLSEDYWGRGIMTKAITEMVKLAFDTFDITRIFATPFETNSASHRVLEKAGFKLETGAERVVYKNEIPINVLVYSIRQKSE